MIEYALPRKSDEPLWSKYASEGFAAGSGHKGFRMFVQHQVPEATVSGTTVDGIRLVFDDERDFTAFLLRWL